MDIERARESLKAAELCVEAGLVNSATSRAYYAMFQAAQVALGSVGATRLSWSHPGLQAAFTAELIHRRKMYPATFGDFLSSGVTVRQAADYGQSGVSRKIAERFVRRARIFVTTVEGRLAHGTDPDVT